MSVKLPFTMEAVQAALDLDDKLTKATLAANAINVWYRVECPLDEAMHCREFPSLEDATQACSEHAGVELFTASFSGSRWCLDADVTAILGEDSPEICRFVIRRRVVL